MCSEVTVPPGAIQQRSRLTADFDSRRRTAGALAGATLLIAVAYGGVAQGGFYPDQQRTLLALTAASGAFGVLAAPWDRLVRHLAIAVPACACAIIAAVATGDIGGAAPVLGLVGAVAVAPANEPGRPLVPVIALAAGGALALIPVRHPRRWLAIAAVLVVGGAALAASVSASRLTVSSPDRDNEWRTTWAVAAAHPLTGVGPSHLVLEWRDTDGQTSAAHATHNEFLQLAAEQGVPGLLVALGTICAIAFALMRRGQRPAIAVLATFLVTSAFDFIWHVPLVPIVVAVVIGAALPFYADQNSSL